MLNSPNEAMVRCVKSGCFNFGTRPIRIKCESMPERVEKVYKIHISWGVKHFGGFGCCTVVSHRPHRLKRS